jgi:uncharacterized protein
MIEIRSFRLNAVRAIALGAILLAPASLARADGSGDPKAMAISEQLMQIAGAKTMMAQMLDQMEPALTGLIQQANPGKEAAVGEVMNQFIFPTMKAGLPEALKQCAGVYADHFTNDELQQLVAFYETPLGAKLTREQPGMALEMGRLGGQWAQKMALAAIQQYAEEFKKRGLQTPI